MHGASSMEPRGPCCQCAALSQAGNGKSHVPHDRPRSH